MVNTKHLPVQSNPYNSLSNISYSVHWQNIQSIISSHPTGLTIVSLTVVASIFGNINSVEAGPVKEKSKTMASLDNIVKEQVVPDVIDSKPAASIRIKYLSGAEVLQGNVLTPTQVKDLPKVTFDAKSDQLYTLLMVDPDAPSRVKPTFREILHFAISNIPGGDLSKGETMAEYIGSGPPKGTGLHRYVFLVFLQKGKLESSMKIPKTSRAGRTNFSARAFAKKHNLGEPIAANFYQAEFDDYVPILHAQLQ